MVGQIKKGIIRFDGANPMSFEESDDAPSVAITPAQQELMDAVSTTIKSYLKTAENLIEGKYKHLEQIVPKYLSHPGVVFIVVCPDGVVVRYESRVDDKRKYAATYMPEGIAHAALLLSQNIVRVMKPGTPQTFDSSLGIEMRMAVVNPNQEITQEIFLGRIWFDVINIEPEQPHQIPSKPYCLLSVRNCLEMELHGALVSQDGSNATEQPFISKAPIRIGAGWECIEVFSGLDANAWKPEYATLWAESDILGAAVMAHQREEINKSLDPKASARKHYCALLAEFRALLDSNPEREQTLQTFLQSNPALLCPAHVRMWPKLPLGAKVTDFVFRDANNDYLLVELERSTLSLFKQDGHPTADLSHAQGQIVDWKRYLEDNLSTVQRELKLDGITTNPHGLVVIGRSSLLSPENRRKLQTMANESPKLRVMTYDDVYDSAKAVLENMLGPMWDGGGTTQILYPVVA